MPASAAALATKSLWIGFLAGALAGVAVALLMALFCIRYGMNQIVIGIALTLGAEGLTALLHHFQFARTRPSLGKALDFSIPILSDIPVIGPALFSHNPLVYFGVALVPILAWMFRRTAIGLNWQAAGDKPGALDASGVSVALTRTGAALATGALAGLGGAYMSEVGAGLSSRS